MNIDASRYNVTVRRDTFDGEVLYEARVKELPDLAEYGETFEEAYELALDAIETTAEAFAEKNRSLPPAQVPIEDYSGRVTLRLPRSLHRSLSITAESEGISLNQFLVSALGHYTGIVAWQQSFDVSVGWKTIKTRQKMQSRPQLRLVDTMQIAQ